MTDERKERDGKTVERDHPQTRKAEDDARGSADWKDDVVLPAGEEEREERRKKINRE